MGYWRNKDKEERFKLDNVLISSKGLDPLYYVH